MQIVRAFVNKENKTSFACPYCDKTYRTSVARFKGIKHRLSSKCTCGKQFKVYLNFRQFYRKDTNLVGEVINLSTNSKDWSAMVVVNLSMGGLRFKAVGPRDIRKGHKLQVRFTLDDLRANEIDKEVRVIDVKDEHYGCEFLNLAFEEKELGYYLRPT